MEFKIECYHQSELDKLRGQPHFRGLTQLEPVTFGGNMTSEEFDLRRRHGGGEDPYAGNVDGTILRNHCAVSECRER